MNIHHPDFSAVRPAFVDDLVRIGRTHDGGYVVSARSVQHVAALISMGISTDWSFETEFLERNPNAHLVAIDGSVSKQVFLRDALWHGLRAGVITLKGRLGEARDEWQQSREARSLRNAFDTFFHRPNRVHIERMIAGRHNSGNTTWGEVVRDMPQHLKTSGAPSWFVKIDIEGAEFFVLPELLEHADNIRGLAIEFHLLDLVPERFDEIIDALKQHFVIVHIHGNNCVAKIPGTQYPCVIELSLMHRSLATAEELARPNTRTYPVANLDQPNCGDKPDYAFLPS